MPGSQGPAGPAGPPLPPRQALLCGCQRKGVSVTGNEADGAGPQHQRGAAQENCTSTISDFNLTKLKLFPINQTICLA